jgi:hypothetical protein
LILLEFDHIYLYTFCGFCHLFPIGITLGTGDLKILNFRVFFCFGIQESHELEDRETLAQMAAEEEDAFALEGETYIGE